MAEDDGIETIDCSDNDSIGQPDKPLMQLFGRLIGSDNKQNTVLTNAQIVEILQSEFNIEILDLHELELDIYLNIMKKFLKDWPQWDELDKIIKKQSGNYKAIQEIIQDKYNNLKKYLKVMLDTSQPMAKEAVANAIEQTAGKVKQIEIDTSDIVMEIQCSRPQLNQLICRQPIPHLKNTIFNIPDNSLNRIIVNPLPLKAILNWWNVSMTVNLIGFWYSREPMQELKHVLVNKKREQEELESKELDEELEIKVDSKKTALYYNKIFILNYLDKLLEMSRKKRNIDDSDEIEAVFNIIKNDLHNFTNIVRIPALYRRYANKYKYIRYLYKDTSELSASKKYDLQLEETLSPRIIYNIAKFEPSRCEVPKGNWLLIECITCSEKFSIDTIDLMKNHFMMHQSEPDWKCTNCNKQFPTDMLMTQNWQHICSK